MFGFLEDLNLLLFDLIPGIFLVRYIGDEWIL